jgi:hypothetical protein
MILSMVHTGTFQQSRDKFSGGYQVSDGRWLHHMIDVPLWSHRAMVLHSWDFGALKSKCSALTICCKGSSAADWVLMGKAWNAVTI